MKNSASTRSGTGTPIIQSKAGFIEGLLCGSPGERTPAGGGSCYSGLTLAPSRISMISKTLPK